ncbi:MAG: aminoacyl-tRNA hydrolase, partial [Candidatus Thermoplasmatota archaeon]
MSYKLVIAVRSDLKLSKGKLAVQVAHASILCANKVKKKILNEWLKYGQKKIVVKLKNLDELFELEKNAKEKDITCEVVADAGLTE